MKDEIIKVIKEITNSYSETNLIAKGYLLSYYDHWLTECEANKEFNINTLDDYLNAQKREATIVKFFLDLNLVYPLLYFDADHDTHELELTSGDIINIVTDGLREIEKFTFYLEKLDLIILSGFDQQTRILFMSDIDHQHFSKLVNESKLFLLN